MRHLDAAWTIDPPMSGVARDLVLFKESFDPFGQGGDDLILAPEQRWQIQGQAGELDAMGGEFFTSFVVALAGFQKRLAGDTSNPEAGAAKRCFLLDTAYVETQLGGANRRYITTWTGTNDDQIVFLQAHKA